MKIIDFEKKGNVVRFYLGKDDLDEYYGDDWDDAPYDCNAGRVYTEFISGHVDIAFPFDYFVLEPCDDWDAIAVTKDDMVNGMTPCLVVVSPETYENREWWDDSFHHWVKARAKGIKKFYFNDHMDDSVPFIVWDEEKEESNK